MFRIEKGIPLPTKFKWADMEIGDSVHLSTDDEFLKAKYSSHMWGRKQKPVIKFTTDKARRRIWRIK